MCCDIPVFRASQHYNISQDNICGKFFAAMPVIGFISTLINEKALQVEWIQPNLTPYFRIALIDVKNHYIVAAIIHSLLAIAVIACFTAFHPQLASTGGLLFGTAMAVIVMIGGIYHVSRLSKNLQERKALEEDLKKGHAQLRFVTLH
jgi:hypothetical protein